MVRGKALPHAPPLAPMALRHPLSRGLPLSVHFNANIHKGQCRTAGGAVTRGFPLRNAQPTWNSLVEEKKRIRACELLWVRLRKEEHNGHQKPNEGSRADRATGTEPGQDSKPGQHRAKNRREGVGGVDPATARPGVSVSARHPEIASGRAAPLPKVGSRIMAPDNTPWDRKSCQVESPDAWTIPKNITGR